MGTGTPLHLDCQVGKARQVREPFLIRAGGVAPVTPGLRAGLLRSNDDGRPGSSLGLGSEPYALWYICGSGLDRHGRLAWNGKQGWAEGKI
jgi:hypothetical protein